jgi:DNA repair protein RAD5
MNEFTGEISDKFIEFKESYGGIVADQMGLGKTLLSIGIILYPR